MLRGALPGVFAFFATPSGGTMPASRPTVTWPRSWVNWACRLTLVTRTCGRAPGRAAAAAGAVAAGAVIPAVAASATAGAASAAVATAMAAAAALRIPRYFKFPPLGLIKWNMHGPFDYLKSRAAPWNAKWPAEHIEELESCAV